MENIVNTILATQSNRQNSLDSIYAPSELDICYVQQNNRYYRFRADSTSTPNGVSVVIPNNIASSHAGRWFIEGPPGPGPKLFGKPGNLTINTLVPSISIGIIPIYSAGHQVTLANQPASGGSVVTNVQVPVTPLAGPPREVIRTGPQDAFTVGGDTGPVTVNLPGGPLGYTWIYFNWQASFSTTHNSANEFYFGFSKASSGVRPLLPATVRMRAEKFSVSCMGPLLIPGGGRDVSQIWNTYYGADALSASELIVNSSMTYIQDTGWRV